MFYIALGEARLSLLCFTNAVKRLIDDVFQVKTSNIDGLMMVKKTLANQNAQKRSRVATECNASEVHLR